MALSKTDRQTFKTLRDLDITKSIEAIFEQFLESEGGRTYHRGTTSSTSGYMPISIKELLEDVAKLRNGTEEYADSLEAIAQKLKFLFERETLSTEEQLELYRQLVFYNNSRITQEEIFLHFNEDILELQKSILSTTENTNKVQEKQTKTLRTNSELYREIKGIVRDLYNYSEEIYKISHELQQQNNLTWKEYSKYYHETYGSARELNKELGKSLFNSKQLLGVQTELIGDGWRGLTAANMSDLASSVALMQKTLGAFPNELSVSFQKSYRLFGDQTAEYIEQMGDRLNIFQDTFGMRIEAMSTLISQMTSSNNFIARSNQDIALVANENLMKASVLAAEIGMTSSNFIAQLAGVAQFGTAAEQASLYSGGALLQGFNTQDFITQLQGQNYYQATEQLFSSIAQTMEGLEGNQLLRAEYMKQIQSAFGLSRDDILQISMGGERLDTIRDNIASKLETAEGSMVDELRGLNVSISDRFDNWWLNTSLNETLGKVAQDLGIFGIEKDLRTIQILLTGILRATTKSAGVDGLSGLLINPKTASTSMGPDLGSSNIFGRLTGTGKLGGAIAGSTIGVGANIYGHRLIEEDQSRVGGWLSNILGGAAGGALTGASVSGGNPYAAVGGAIMGLTAGVVNSVIAEQKRQSAFDAYEKNMRDAQRQQRLQDSRAGQTQQTDNPIVDAINNMNDNLTSVITGEGAASRQVQFTSDLVNKTWPITEKL